MKRSKLITQLTKYLQKETGHLESKCLAVTILDMCEDAGMLPPPTHISHKKGSCLCGHGEWCEYCNPYGVSRCEWGAEDEKK